jgi:hypothetical protein
VVWNKNVDIPTFIHDPSSPPFWMPFSSAGTRSLTFYPVLLASLLKKFRAYARINRLRQIVRNLLLGLALSNATSNFLNRVLNITT